MAPVCHPSHHGYLLPLNLDRPHDIKAKRTGGHSLYVKTGLLPVSAGRTCCDEAEDDNQHVHRLQVRGTKVPVHMENPFLYEGDG